MDFLEHSENHKESKLERAIRICPQFGETWEEVLQIFNQVQDTSLHL